MPRLRLGRKMKFNENSPNIPDRLLWERDEGKVVFICGAGVSAQGAGLPNFKKLASKVMKRLRVPKTTKKRKILGGQKGGKDTIETDMIFRRLEQNYPIWDIERSVCKILNTSSNDLEFHRTICDLSTDQNGKMRLITTNFDDLFSRASGRKGQIYPNLPDLKESKDIDDLFYLHGKCGESEKDRESNLVLSTRSFGQAYMSEGWAAKFIKNILQNFTVVFIGYSADDPPVQYLLDALSDSQMTRSKKRNKVYAFQRGDRKVADEKWKHRGVEPICFSEYEHLWETLRLWRDRAMDFGLWASRVLDAAMSGPSGLPIWQISQVIHLATHPVGARAIANHESPISPKWLYIFDSETREDMDFLYSANENKIEQYDPFRALGLEEEAWFESQSRDMRYSRSSPRRRWDAFRTSSYDNDYVPNLAESGILFGQESNRPRDIPNRLWYLKSWIVKISDNPISIRWAILKDNFHPHLKRGILNKFINNTDQKVALIARAWEELIGSWESNIIENEYKLSQLQERVKECGWTHYRVSEYERLFKPVLVPDSGKLKNEYLLDGVLPKDIDDIVTFRTSYVEEKFDFSKIGDWEREVLSADRRNLDFAMSFFPRAEPYEHMYIPSMLKDDDIEGEEKHYGVSSSIFRYIERFVQVYNSRPDIAMSEFITWPKDDKNVYSRFLIFLIGNDYLLEKEQIASILTNLPDDVFWGDHHRRDLLFALKSRWADFDDAGRSCIGEKIISGDSFLDKRRENDAVNMKAHYSLNMIQWLDDNGCKFPPNILQKFEELKTKCQSWSSERAIYAAKDMGLRVGYLSKNTDDKVLDGLSLNEVADVVERTSGYDFDNHEENIPFAGLCIRDRRRAFAVLKLESRHRRYPEALWREWFKLEWDGEILRCYLPLTTALLCRASMVDLYEVIRYVYDWFFRVSKHYEFRRIWLRDWLFENLISILESNPGVGESSICRSPLNEISWINEALNSPTGQLVEGLCGYREVRDLSDGNELPLHWINKVNRLLSLTGDNRRYALVRLMFRLQWLHHYASKWTEDNVIIFSRSKCNFTLDAYWEGFADGASHLRDPRLFLKIKISFLDKLSTSKPVKDCVLRRLSAVMLSGWTTKYQGRRLISNREFGSSLSLGSERLRVHILIHVKRKLEKDKKLSSSDGVFDLEKFLIKIWPLEISAISNETNQHLLSIVFSNPEVIPKFIDLIMPRLDRMKDLDMVLYRLRREMLEAAEMHPKYMFEILLRILHEEALYWPEHISSVLDVIESHNPKVTGDGRFIELRRRFRGE